MRPRQHRTHGVGPYEPEGIDAAIFRHYWVDGWSQDKIAKHFRMARSTVGQRLRKFGEWEHNENYQLIRSHRAGVFGQLRYLYATAHEQWMKSIDPQTGRGDVHWWKAMLDAQKAIRELWGLDAAQKMEVHQSGSNTVRIGRGGVAEAKREIERRLERAALERVLALIDEVADEETAQQLRIELYTEPDDKPDSGD